LQTVFLYDPHSLCILISSPTVNTQASYYSDIWVTVEYIAILFSDAIKQTMRSLTHSKITPLYLAQFFMRHWLGSKMNFKFTDRVVAYITHCRPHITVMFGQQ